MPYLERDAARIWWEAAGSGPPVLLIMGLGYPSDMWYRTLPALTPYYRTIRLDNRGVGRTGVPPGPYPIELLSDDAAAVVEAAGEGSAHVIGLSLGGVIAQELALAHPRLVRSLALLSTHPGGAAAIAPEPAALQMLTARSTMTPREAAECAIPFVYAPDTDADRIRADIDVRMQLPTEPAGYAHQLLGSVGYRGAYSRLASIRVPTLVVHGSNDRLVPPANGRLIAGAVPGARLVILDGASHIVFTDRTEQLNATLLEFLASAATSGG